MLARGTLAAMSKDRYAVRYACRLELRVPQPHGPSQSSQATTHRHLPGYQFYHRVGSGSGEAWMRFEVSTVLLSFDSDNSFPTGGAA